MEGGYEWKTRLMKMVWYYFNFSPSRYLQQLHSAIRKSESSHCRLGIGHGREVPEGAELSYTTSLQMAASNHQQHTAAIVAGRV